MSGETHALLAREGRVHIIVASIAAVAAYLLFDVWVALPFILLAVFVLQFFRDPRRVVPTEPGLVVAPADGRIIWTGVEQDPYLDRKSYKISIFMNVFNVHSNRIPVAGQIRKSWYNAGKFFNAAMDKASLENERNALWIRTEQGLDITCVQVAGLIARRIMCYAEEGEDMRRGQRYGFIRFGSRVDLFLPLHFEPLVECGTHTVGGVSILGKLGELPEDETAAVGDGA
jgi:phosphatidylserine decarboxylase